ncbi:MAG: hypothetical protein CME25_02195 [Gemmatimonadetes bacterium]|nr:hypothetical protein [Gemmatimonadota bacterium]
MLHSQNQAGNEVKAQFVGVGADDLEGIVAVRDKLFQIARYQMIWFVLLTLWPHFSPTFVL